MSELLVNTIKKADGTGSLSVPAESGTVVVKDGSNNVTLNDITAGGVYLGGTGAANFLDDYEEGTWSLSVISSANVTSISGSDLDYVKIGQMVMITGSITFSVTSTGVRTFIQITVPFGAEDNTTQISGGGMVEGPSPFLGIAGGWAGATSANNTQAYFSFVPVATGSHFHAFSVMYKST